MTVNIETSFGYRTTAEMDGNTFVMDKKDDELLSDLSLVRVWGVDYRKTFTNALVYEVKSTDSRYRFKLMNETPLSDRIRNVEAAITELYEMVIGG